MQNELYFHASVYGPVEAALGELQRLIRPPSWWGGSSVPPFCMSPTPLSALRTAVLVSTAALSGYAYGV